jgi:hypothetical protein
MAEQAKSLRSVKATRGSGAVSGCLQERQWGFVKMPWPKIQMAGQGGDADSIWVPVIQDEFTYEIAVPIM